MAIGQKPVPSVNLPIPTKIGSLKWVLNSPKQTPEMGSQNGFDNHSQMSGRLLFRFSVFAWLGSPAGRPMGQSFRMVQTSIPGCHLQWSCPLASYIETKKDLSEEAKKET